MATFSERSIGPIPKARPTKPLSASPVGPPSSVTWLDPALHKADAKAVFESFDRQHFQVGQNTVLKMGVWILCVELHVPDAAQFNIRLRKKLCVGHARNERPVVQAQIYQSAGLERSCRRPKR